jgi:hypothetical protein
VFCVFRLVTSRTTPPQRVYVVVRRWESEMEQADINGIVVVIVFITGILVGWNAPLPK